MTWADAVNVLVNTLHDRHPAGKWVWAELPNTEGGYSCVAIKCSIENNKIAIMTNGDGHVFAEFAFYTLLGQDIVADGAIGGGPSFVIIPNVVRLRFHDRGMAEKVADALYCIQQYLQSSRDTLNARLATFEPVAAQYRARETKPQMSEEQRKQVVQANTLTEKKQYADAIEKYFMAITLDPTSYPGAYYNLALLEAQINLPFAAIAYMKQYLLLVPDAPDARSAQDKIYEWELLIRK
jgi:tetratricopeptide (TPR) repeat protein